MGKGKSKAVPLQDWSGPECSRKLKFTDWSEYTCLTQLYAGRDMFIIYYVNNSYMFRPFRLAIFRLINEKKLVSSYTGLMCVVYSGGVRGEVGTRSGICCVGWVVWVQGLCCYVLF